MILETNLETFVAAYEVALRAAHAKTPSDYAFDTEELPKVVAKMKRAFVEGAIFGKWPCQSPNIQKACRAVGIKPSFKALREYLTGGSK